MARKKKQGEASSGAYWMDTYGDMITLVLTFFVLLFSMSTIDAAKYEALVATLTGTPLEVVAPLNPGKSVAADPSDFRPADKTPEQLEQEEQERMSKQSFNELLERIKALVEERDLESSLLIEANEDSVTLRFLDSLLFNSGEADILTESMAIVLDVVEILEASQEYIKVINIEGHTDNVPISNFRFRNNWDLSVMRATTVLQEFAEKTTIPGSKLRASGYGEFEQVTTNDTAEGRARNRRVDIVVDRLIFDSDYNPYPNIDELIQSLQGDSPRAGALWEEGM